MATAGGIGADRGPSQLFRSFERTRPGFGDSTQRDAFKSHLIAQESDAVDAINARARAGLSGEEDPDERERIKRERLAALRGSGMALDNFEEYLRQRSGRFSFDDFRQMSPEQRRSMGYV